MRTMFFLSLLLVASQAFAMGQQLPNENSGSAGSSSGTGPTATPVPASGSSSSILEKYSYLDPQKVVPTAALERILTYYDAHKSSLGNPYYITVIDFTKHSSTKRMHVIDMQTGAVTSYLTAHGKGSEGPTDDGYASVFSNVPGSNASSLGLYKTGAEFTSSHGPSMYLYGLESTNSNVYDREIILHGAWYVSQDVINESGRIGRSEGCPAVEDRYAPGLSATLQGGSLMIAWHN